MMLVSNEHFACIFNHPRNLEPIPCCEHKQQTFVHCHVRKLDTERGIVGRCGTRPDHVAGVDVLQSALRVLCLVGLQPGGDLVLQEDTAQALTRVPAGQCKPHRPHAGGCVRGPCSRISPSMNAHPISPSFLLPEGSVAASPSSIVWPNPSATTTTTYVRFSKRRSNRS